MKSPKFKLILLLIVMAAFGIEMRAESEPRSHNVFVDFFGSSNIISVNYDTRFPGSPVFGWRAGVGYSQSKFRGDAGWFGNYRKGISLPLGFNALFGKQASKFELGVAITPGLYSFRDSRRVFEEREHGWYEGHEDFGPTTWRGACAVGLDLGYRLQRKRGFLFRVGISRCLNINSDGIYLNLLSFIPYLSFGYSFK